MLSAIDVGVGHLPWAGDLPEARDVHRWDEGVIRTVEAWLGGLFAEHYRGVTMLQLREKVAEWHATDQRSQQVSVFQYGSEKDRRTAVVVVLHDWYQRGKLSTNGRGCMSLPPGAGC